MKQEQIIAIYNNVTNKYFFTTDHCQAHNLGKEWISFTFNLPLIVSSRKDLKDGIVKDKETWKIIFGSKSPIIGEPDYEEIPNPQQKYQA